MRDFDPDGMRKNNRLQMIQIAVFVGTIALLVSIAYVLL